MFVKQITETELTEYERALQGTIDSVKQLTANDEETRALVRGVVDSCEDLQTALRVQIAGYHVEPSEPEHVPAPVED